MATRCIPHNVDLTMEKRATFFFTIAESGYFGIPEDGWVVVPAGTQAQIAATIGHETGRLAFDPAEHSVYREESDRLHASFTIGELTITIDDNRLAVTRLFSLENEQVQRSEMISYVEVILKALSLFQGRYFSAINSSVVDDEGNRHTPVTENLVRFKIKTYNLVDLADHIRRAFNACTKVLGDITIKRSLDYFNSGLRLESARMILKPRAAFYEEHDFVPETFLYFWKAIAMLIGEKQSTKRFSERCRGLGLTKQEISHISKLYRLRNDYDVAHTRRPLAATTEQKVSKQDLTNCKETARRLLVLYIEKSA